MSLAWEVTNEDIETALDALGLNSSEGSVESARESLDEGAVERAALRSTDFDEQCQFALDEIKSQLAPKSGELLVDQA